MPFTIGNWLLAITPVLVLIAGILLFKWEASKVGAVSWIVALGIAYFFFGTDLQMIALANSKGLSLSLYVFLIIWGAIFLYNVADGAGGIKVIGKTISGVSDDRRIMILLLAWCFTSMLQGLAGFGIPVAVVAPILVVIGFEPLVAVSASLIGHSWAISFGSMGSSYNSIQLVTGIPGEVIGPWMAIIFSVGIFATGFGVAHIYGGWAAVKKSVPQILTAGTAMSFVMWLMTIIGTAQLASLMAASAGCLVMILWAITGKRKQKAEVREVAEKSAMSFNTAFSPYYTLIVVSILTQIKPIKTALSGYNWGLAYPELQTSFGYVVTAVSKYSKIQFFSHPAPILLLSSLVGYAIYVTRIGAKKNLLKTAALKTVDKAIPTSVGIGTMVMMALIMSDSGMTNVIAQGIANVFGSFFPLVSPYIGVLGSFITGSNTNSNVMFGVLQQNTAIVLGVSPVLMAAAQSVGGSLGVAISPSTIMTGAANVGLNGRENEIMKITMKYCLINVMLVGIFVFLLSNIY